MNHYTITTITDTEVQTNNGNFPINKFILGINGLELNKTYTFEFRGNGRILRFYEVQEQSTSING